MDGWKPVLKRSSKLLVLFVPDVPSFAAWYIFGIIDKWYISLSRLLSISLHYRRIENHIDVFSTSTFVDVYVVRVWQNYYQNYWNNKFQVSRLSLLSENVGKEANPSP